MVVQHPVLRQVVLDATDARELADFDRELLGLRWRAGGRAGLHRPGARRGGEAVVGVARR